MGVTADLRVSSDSTILGRLSKSIPSTTLEVEPTIPVGEMIFPLVWVYAEDESATKSAILDSELAEVIDVVERHDDHVLYRLEWLQSDELVNCLTNSSAILLEASGNGKWWHFQIRFTKKSEFTNFQSACIDRGIDVIPRRIINGASSEECLGHLTNEQREVIQLALEQGYFEVPRHCTLKTIADELDISDQAASARLRRGMKKLLSGILSTDSKEMLSR
jgi:predicted DNA binding protein